MTETLTTRGARLRGALAYFAKLFVMGLVALAISAGLRVQLGWDHPAALGAGIGLFLAFVALHAWIARRPAHTAEAEGAVEQTAAQAHRPAQEAETEGATGLHALDELVARLERLEQMVAAGESGPADGPNRQTYARAAQVDRLAAEVDRLSVRVDALRNQFEIEAKERQEQLEAKLNKLHQMVAPLTHGEAEPVAPSRRPASADDGAALNADRLDAAVIEAVRRSVEANRIDLYLQPIVALPQRRVRYYEALSRLRDGGDNLLMPKDFLQIAASAGLMPLIDNVMLYRSVQVLKRLSERSSARGVFCNVSVQSLLDAEFFPELIAFLEQNRALADGLHFEFAQDLIETRGAIEAESLASLAKLGFRFVLDQVHTLDVDFAALHEMGFRFVKIEGDLLLHRMAQAGARIHAADMRAYLDRYGLDLIVEKIEDERSLAELLEFDIRLGQGYLFSEPRPVRPEVYGAAPGAAEAA